MTRAELLARMTNAEFLVQRAYDMRRRQEQELAEAKAKSKSRRRR